MREKTPLYVANEALFPNQDLPVFDKFSGREVTRTALAGPEHIEAAIVGAVEATEAMRSLPAYRRAAILHHCVSRFEERFDELADTLCI